MVLVSFRYSLRTYSAREWRYEIDEMATIHEHPFLNRRYSRKTTNSELSTRGGAGAGAVIRPLQNYPIRIHSAAEKGMG